MRTASTFSNVYLALLLIELAVLGYDGLVKFDNSTLGEWVRIVVMVFAVVGFYGWSRRLWVSWKWVWRLVFVLVYGWFFVYLPMEIYQQRELLEKMNEEIGLGAMVFGYLVLYLLHFPLFHALYSAAFHGSGDTSGQAAQGPNMPPLK